MNLQGNYQDFPRKGGKGGTTSPELVLALQGYDI